MLKTYRFTRNKYHIFMLLSSLMPLIPTASQAQIAHIMDRTGGVIKEGLSSRVEVSVEKKSGNSSTARVLADAGVYFKHEQDLYMLIGKRDYGEQNRLISSDASFLHARYRRSFGPVFQWEVFTQIDKDRFKKREMRSLFGTGPRFQLLASANQNFAVGMAPMLEQERYTKDRDSDRPRTETKTRVSFSTAYTLKLDQHVAFNLSAYYQPDIEAAADYRFSLETGIDIQMHDHLSFQTALEQTTDANAPKNTKKTDTLVKQSLVFLW